MEPRKMTYYKIKTSEIQNSCDKRTTLKMKSCNKMNQFHGLSYDETLFLSYQKVPKVKIAYSSSIERDLY